MTRAELEAALAWADWINGVGYEVPKIISAKKGAEILAAAVRSLRETVKAREEEIENCKAGYMHFVTRCDELESRLHKAGINPSLDQALNEGDGSYKP